MILESVKDQPCRVFRSQLTEFLSLGFWHRGREIEFNGGIRQKSLSSRPDLMRNVPESELDNLEALLLNTSGNIPLHNRFRALFTLKALKSDQAVHIISKGGSCLQPVLTIDVYAGFQDPSVLLKHELAYCLGQMKNKVALSNLESVLTNEQEDPMVRHEVSPVLRVRRQRVHVRRQPKRWVLSHRPRPFLYSKSI